MGADTYQFFKNDVSLGAASPSRTVTATAGSSGAQFNNGDRIKVQVVADGCTFTNEITILVDFFADLNSASISTNAPSDTICANESITITAGPPVPGYTYSFTLNGVPAALADVVGRVYTTTAITQQSTVTVVVTNASGCSDTVSLTIFVPKVATAGTVSANADDLVLCPGDNIASDISSTNPGTLDASSSAGSVLTYQWQERNVSTGNVWTNLTGATSSALDISATPLSITEDTGIRRLTFATVNTVSCAVNGLPSNVININVEELRSPTITTNPGTTVCAEDVTNLVFTANTSNAQLSDTYQWAINGTDVTTGNGYAQNETGATYQVDTLGDITDGAVVTVRTATAAPDSCTETSPGITMSISLVPTANLDSNATAETICDGGSIVITADDAGVGATYAFRLNGVGVPAGEVVGRVYTTTAITQQSTVTVEVASAGGCSAIDTLTIFVPKVATAGTVSANADDLVLCPGDNIASDISSTNPGTLDASSSAGSVLTYQWQERNATTGNVWTNLTGATSSALDISATPLSITEDTGIRRLTFATVNTVSCAVNGLPSNVININVEELRSPTITTNPGTTVCAEDVTNLVFTANTSNAQLSDTYQWAINGTDVTTGNGYAQNETGATYQVDTLGDITDGAVVTVRTATAAPDSCTETSPGITMSISLVPTANLDSTVSAAGGIICGGLDVFNQPYAATVTFTADVVAGADYRFFNGINPLTPFQASNVFATDNFSIYDTDLQFDIVVEVRNASGCSATDTVTINLNYVTADTIQIVGGGVSQNICGSTTPTANFESVGAEDAPDGTNDFVDGADYPNGAVISYQWESSIDGGANWNPVLGSTSRTMTPTVIYQTTQYRRRSRSVLNGVNISPCDNYSNIITINVAANTAGGNVQRNINPGLNTWADIDEIICVGGTPQELRVINSVGGAGSQFQWQYSFDNLSWQDITLANGFATDATAAQYQPSAITATNLSSVSSFTITNYANANGVGDIYRVTLSADSFSVTVGEVFDAAAVGSGVSPVDTVDEVLALLEYKINDSGSGITAVDNAATDNIQIILAPGSVLVPTYLISDGGADETGANSANALTYNALGSIRYYRRVMTESFGGAILPVCQTFSDTHSVEISSVIAGKVSNTNLVICNNTAPTAFNSIRNAYATNIGATLVYQWYRTTDAARTVWAVIPGANLSTLNFGTALTQSTAFKRRVTSTYSATVCFSETDPVTISVLDQVNTAFILADQSICRVAGSPLTVDVNDLANIIANAAEPDDGIGDGIAYQWQFSADNLNWDDITAGSRADLLNGGFAATLSQTTVITAAQIDTDIERRLQTLIDPDIPTIVYYRLETTRFNDVNDNNILDAGEVSCEVLSGATQISVSEQPTLVQTTAPISGQTICIGSDIDPITFQYGGSATGIRLVNTPGGLTAVTDGAAKTITLSGQPTGTGFIRVTTTGTTCEILTLQHFVRVTTAPQIPDYILIDDVAGGTDPIPIINAQDGNIYNGQTYLCEQALAVSPGTRIFSACYNDGRVAPLTESYNWFISPPAAGTISRTTGFATWNDGFFGDATIQVVAVGCDGSATATLTTVVTVNQFDASASNPTEPVPLLEAESEIIYLRENAGNIRSQERYNITLNGVRYTYETTDTDDPADGIANQTTAQIATELRDLINNDTTSPVAGLFSATAGSFNPGDANNNGLNDDVGGIVTITAQYDGNSAPVIPPGTPRGSGGDMSISFSVTKSPVAGRAFGSMFGFETNPTSEVICGVSTGAEPICETTALTPNTQYFSTASNYSSIRYAISNVVAGAGSVALPGSFVNSNTIDWNAGFHGTFNVDSYATGCNGIENATPGVHTVRIYQNLPAPLDINYNLLTLPNCPAGSAETTQFSSSSNVTWSWNNESAGTLNSVTGLVTWSTGWSGTVVITATSFGCGGGSISRTVIVPDSPSFTRISGSATTNQSLCIGGNITAIKYKILGGATGADVTGIDDLNLFEQLTSENQVDRFVIAGLMADAGDIYTLTIDQVPYTVTIGEDATAAGGADVVNLLEEVVQVFVYKINQAALGITAVNDGPAGQFTLTSNNFDFNVSSSFNDALGDDGVISFNRTVVADGGTFIEISGTISGSLGITVPTTYQYLITTTGGTCTPTTAQGFISVSPNSSMTMQVGMINSQTVCNNSIGAVTPIVYNLTNASTVNVAWTPSRPTGINHTHVIQNQISTIVLGGVDADVAANNGQDYTVTINSITVTYTINIAAPQNDNEITDILNGLRALIGGTGLLVDVLVVGGNSLRITSRNGISLTVSSSDPGINTAVFAAPNLVQSATNSLTIFGDPAVAGLAVDTVFGFTITTVNNVFGCNNPADQVSLTGSITIAPEAAISLTTGNNNLIVCQGETVSSTQGGVDIEWDITGYALGATVGAGQLPQGINSSYTEIPQITEITFAGNPGNFDDTDIYRITVNGVINTVTVNAGAGLDTFASILQQFETLIDSNVPLVDASYAANTLTIQSNTGDAVSVARSFVDTTGDGGDPTLNAPNVTQANRKFIRIFGAPTDPAAIYPYTITTFGPSCDPATANGTIRVVDTPSISVAPGSDANPSQLCNQSPMTDINFNISTFATYAVTWTGALGQPAGISLVRTTSSTISLISDPVINIPGAVPAGGVSYTYQIISTVNDNGCSSVASFTGIVNIINGTATLDLNDASSLTDDRVNADGGPFNPSVAPDYVLIEACQGSILDDALFDATVDITNVAIAAGGNLPSGLFGDFTPGVGGAVGQFRIYGTPDTATTEDIVLQAITDACTPAADIRVRIVVYPNSTITLDAGSNDNQTVCNNTVLTNISYTLVGAIDATIAGLPNGLVGNSSAPNKFIISGTPSVNISETTSYTYTITSTGNSGGPLVGSCAETTITGVVTVRPDESLTVTSGSVIQQVCYGENITSIVISVVGDNTFGSVANPANLPAGMNFNFVEDADNMGGIVTISGSPSAAIVGNNPFTYSFITTTGGANTSACTDATQQIDITVVPPSSLAFSGPDPAIINQTVCAGTLINEIEFSMGGGSSNVNITFDAGLGFSRPSNARVNDPSDAPDNAVIFGTAPNALVQTIYNYEITTINQCDPGTNEISVAGTITVIPTETITHRGASGATTQDVCVNQNVTPMIFDVTGQNTHAKFVDASLVPSGISLDFAPDQVTGNGGVATILGSPDSTNVAKDYTFQITTGVSGAVSNTSQCTDQTQSITISVKPSPTMVFSGADSAAMNQSVCQETAITPIQFTLGGGANDVTFSSSPAGLGFTRPANVSVDGNSVQIFGNSPIVAVETTFTYSISTVNPNSCTPSVTLGGSITVFPPVQYNNWAGNHTVNNPLCSGDGGSIVVNAAAVTGGFVAIKQQSRIELNNSFAVGNIITISVGPQLFAYTVQGVDNATGNLSNNPAIYDRAQSKSEIITEIAGLINNINTGSTLVTAIGNSPSVGIATLIAKTSGIGFTTSGTKQPGASPGTITISTPIPNQSLTYEYYWRQTNSIGTPVTTLDTADPTTYVDTGLTLNLNSVTGSEYYMLTTVSNNCQADAPFVTITAPDPLALSITTICDTEITANGSGGTGQLIYILYNSGGTEIGRSPAIFGSHTFSDGDANNIPGGGTINITPGFQYQIGINDQNACSINGNDSTVQINTPLALVIDENKITITPPSCAGNDGSIQLDTGGFTITGGSAGNTGDYSNLTFLWTKSGGGTFNTQDIFGLSPADYTLTVTDNLCNTLFITSNPITIVDTADFIVTNAVDNTTVSNCSDGHLQVSVAGGSSNFSFAWTDQFGVSRGTTNRIENLDAGIYTLIVKDTTTNCEQIFTYTITGSSGPLQALDEIALGQANFITTDILCNGGANGAFTVEFTGGNPPYSYSLNGAAYVSNGFTTSTSSVTSGGASATVVSFTTQILSLDGLEGGTYSVKIKDSGLCLDDSGNIVELNLGSATINEPDELTVNLNSTSTQPIDCSAGIQGSLSINVTGGTVSGTTPYSILWELLGPSGAILYKRTTSASSSNPNGFTISGLDYAGDYTVTVTDGAGCSISDQVTLEDGGGSDPLVVGETPTIKQPGCNSAELGSIELAVSGGLQPYDIKWYKLSVAQASAISSVVSGSVASPTTSSSTIEFSDGGYVSMNKDGFFLVDNLQAGKYRAIITDANGCQIFSRSGVIKNSEFNIINQRLFNREILDCSTGTVVSDFSFNLSGTSLAYNISLDGVLVYGGAVAAVSSPVVAVASPTFTNTIIKQGTKYIIRDLSEGRHILEVTDASNPDCSLDYAFDIETYVPITFEGDTEFEYDICSESLQFSLDIDTVIGGNPQIDSNDNAIYRYNWTFTPSDPTENGASFVNITSFNALRGTYTLIISDGICESTPIDFVFSANIVPIQIGGLLTDANGNSTASSGVSCELNSTDGRISLEIIGGLEPYNITWEIFDAAQAIIISNSSSNTSTSTLNSPWIPLDGTYPTLGNFNGFTVLNDLPSGLYRYTITSGTACDQNTQTSFNYLRDVISIDDDNTLLISDGPYIDQKLCSGQGGLLLIDVYNNDTENTQFYFNYIDTNGTPDTGDDGLPVSLDGNTTKLDEDTFQILIDTPFEYGKLVITTDTGCGIETEIDLALGTPYFTYTSSSFEQVGEIPAREIITFLDESEGEYSRLEWNFGDNSPVEVVNISATASGVAEIKHQYGNSGLYYPSLTIYNELGCFESVIEPIVIGKGYSIYTPNVFTPNNDCLNDFFRPLFSGFKTMQFSVYDYRGNLVYTEAAQDGSVDRTKCPNVIDATGNGKSILGWNGKLTNGLEPSAFSPYYVYSISGEPLYGTSATQVIERSGIFTIIK
ncbi:hypothetical protein N9799_01110 [Flavobacteriaceae bacterium]|nr:hypothetical protein [Flavobacteriaceae bacterium]